MKYDFPLLFFLVGIGLATRRLTWRVWFFVTMMVFLWIMVGWKQK